MFMFHCFLVSPSFKLAVFKWQLNINGEYEFDHDRRQ